MRYVWLGNHSAVSTTYPEDADGRRLPAVRTPHPPGKRCTRVEIPDADSFGEAFRNVTHEQHGCWALNGDGSPAWVASNDPALAAALGAHFGCEVREPDLEG
jgi:hypothetical protein